jgi:lysophospholipase L1-like esterase
LMSYPVDILKQYAGPLHADIFSGIAKQKALPFVDNHTIFRGLKDDFNNYFVSDGHCNAKGYGLIAANIYKVIKPILDKDN